MTVSRRTSAALVPCAALLAACSATTHHYSAERFNACLHRNHQASTLTLDRRSASTAVLVMSPAVAEWVYFFATTKAASAERQTIQAGTTRRLRVMSKLLRTQWSNALVFAPSRAA